MIAATVKTGRWSDPTVWKNGTIPSHGSEILINPKHTITLDVTTNVSGIFIDKLAALNIDPKKNISIQTNKSVKVSGRLLMKPSSVCIHSLTFVDINETLLKGKILDQESEDTGLWIEDSGTVELVGTNKTAWLNLADSAKTGDTFVTLKAAPIGWKIGDELSITPTDVIDNESFYSSFDEVKIKSIKGSTIYLERPLKFNHPKTTINGRILTAEVLNLTRNVVIQGTGDGTSSPETNGRAHIMFKMSKSKPIISNVLIKHMGPRRRNGSTTEKIIGRYGLHFHMCGIDLSGTIVKGVVIKDCGSHCYVPHASHGITFKDCISYNSFNCSYWWDLPPDNGIDPINNTNNVLFDNCVSAKLSADPSFRGYRLANFMLGSGLGNEVRNCVAVGNRGTSGAAGYIWPESSNYTDNLWIFNVNNVAHNNATDGIFTWQNDPHSHRIDNFVGYNNGNAGIEHGAYTNAYKYSNILLSGNKYGIFLHANTRPKGERDEFGYIISFKNVYSTNPLYITRHTLKGETPVLFKDCTFPQVIVNELPRRIPFAAGLIDMVYCNIKPENFLCQGIEEGSLIRVQNIEGSFQLNDKGSIEPISNFFS